MTKKLLVICLVLGITSLVFSTFFLDKSKGETYMDFSRLPISIGQWEGENLEVEERVVEILETDNILLRRYFGNDKIPVHVSIVYAQDNRSAFHPPEICYEGSSFKLVSKEPRSINIKNGSEPFLINRLLLKQDDMQMISYYWFMLGDKATSNYYKQQLALVMSELKNQGAMGAIIQITTAVGPGGVEEADSRISGFVRESFEHISNMLN